MYASAGGLRAGVSAGSAGGSSSGSTGSTGDSAGRKSNVRSVGALRRTGRCRNPSDGRLSPAYRDKRPQKLASELLPVDPLEPVPPAVPRAAVAAAGVDVQAFGAPRGSCG